ncbi:MAG TPA: hypothetical protein VKW76_07405 [Candidatus Binatia bacterium]|nr:hypothetical protein [Candidatus Binatia bacterium]
MGRTLENRRRSSPFGFLDRVRWQAVVAVFSVVWLLRRQAALEGAVWGWSHDAVANTSAVGSTLIQFGDNLRPLAVLLAATLCLSRFRSARVAGFVLLGAEFGYATLLGRRWLLELLILGSLLALQLRSWMRLRRSILWLGLAGAFMVLIAWPFVFHFRAVARTAGLESAPRETRVGLLVTSVLPQAIRTFHPWTAAADRDYADNMRLRSTATDFLIGIERAHRRGVSFQDGAVFETGVLLSVPRFLWPNKGRLASRFVYELDDVVEEHFHLPAEDAATTLTAQGYADDGILGVALYFMALGGILALFTRCLYSARSTIIGFLLYGMGISLAFQVEMSVTAVLAAVRIGVGLVLVDRLCGRRIQQWTVASRENLRPRA